jgi:hypothetical protein
MQEPARPPPPLALPPQMQQQQQQHGGGSGMPPPYGMPPPGMMGGGPPPGLMGGGPPPGMMGGGPPPMGAGGGYFPPPGGMPMPMPAQPPAAQQALGMSSMGPAAAGGKRVGVVRQAAGQRWVDPTLLEWPENDYRIFVGNLGNEVRCAGCLAARMAEARQGADCCLRLLPLLLLLLLPLLLPGGSLPPRPPHPARSPQPPVCHFSPAGPQVSDAVLAAAFQRFPTFQKAKVVRYAHSGKTKGYGFVSFGDMAEGAKVVKEMQGKYVGEWGE